MARRAAAKGKKDGGRRERQEDGRKPAAARRGGSVAVADLNGLASDSDDDQRQQDAFQARRDKVSLRASDDEDDYDDQDDLCVMDLPDSDDDSPSGDDDEDLDDEELDDDELLEREIQRGGKLAQMAKQAKQIAQRLKLQRGEASSDEEGSEDEEGSDEEADGAAAKRKAAKRGAKRGAEEDGGDALAWGASKRAYYDDGDEEPEDEEDLLAEEEEVKRLQRDMAKKGSAADYGLSSSSDDDDSQGEEGSDDSDEGEDSDREGEKGTLGAAVKKAAANGGVSVERVAKQLDALTADERTAAVLSDAPELASLIAELTAALDEVRHRVGPLVSEVRAGKFATREGLSYLEAKHMLLLQYALHIVFYLLLKAEGRPVKDHPVIARLVEIRAYLEKIRPIDKQLAYQVDKLLRAATAAHAADAQAAAGPAGDEDEDDELAAAPRPDRLVSRAEAAAAAGAEGEGADGAGVGVGGRRGSGLGSGGGVYKPPRLNPVSMELDDDKKRSGGLSRDERRLLAEARRRAAQSETLADLAAEVADAPEERRAELAGFDTLVGLKQRQKLALRAQEEEDAFIRVPLSRDQAKALRASKRAGFSTAAVMGDFADDVAGLVAASGEGAEPDTHTGGARNRAQGLAAVFAKQRVSQAFGGEAPAAPAAGGDQDLPRRATLGERRAAYDAVAARRAARGGGGGSDEDGGMDGGGGSEDEYDLAPGRKRGGGGGGKRHADMGEEDDFYTQAKEAAQQRKRARSDSKRAPSLLPPSEDPTVAGARPIGYDIQKNRGLTPHRRRDIKNPRKHQRVKFQKAMVRRRGAVQDGAAHRDTGHAAYGGEATGLKSRVVKSRKL